MGGLRPGPGPSPVGKTDVKRFRLGGQAEDDGDSLEWLILEVAMLSLKPGTSAQFEAAFRKASSIIASMPGYVSHELQRCLEVQDRYILLVRWQTLADHTLGFRGSEAYQEWRRLLHHFYEPFPTVEHYEEVE